MNNNRIVNRLAYQVRPPDRSDLPTGPTSQRGQSILEVLIALAAILLVITALVRGIVISVKSSDFSRLTSQASSYASEGMENVRIYRDGSPWTTFWDMDLSGGGSGTSYGLSGTTPSGLPCTPANGTIIGTEFVRCLKLVHDGSKMKATVTVSWTDSVSTHQSEIVTFFTDWN